ncbi:glycoside hydrolase [Siculibacillus lacustris]|uniref:Beta-xylanase n=1 Tax=Siculibacillus lacustris TaxID=1549641 RepID=A0A4Q9VNX4_9HYPH|nr:endo-1,4-beta-xylanase [Siculibacillus lacustris]TBW36464.1 glycoside hydrolase [Siculibacillus lacustris]
MHRRDVLTSAAALAAATLLPRSATAAAPAVPSLGELAARAGIVFGCSFDVEAVAEKPYADLIRRHARTLTTDNSLKFGALRWRGPEADFYHADRLIDFASDLGLPVRGHNLIWGDFNPEWLLKESQARRIYWLDRHIDEVVGRYAGRITAWDVVNEPFWPDHGHPGGFRGGPWYDALGPGYIDRAFRRAAAADPSARLVLNEAFTESPSPLGLKVRAGLVKLTADLKSKGVKLDAVGLESHIAGDGSFDPPGFGKLIADLAASDVDVYLTELDVDDHTAPGDAAARDRRVAEIYRSVLDTALAHPRVTTVVCWQLADRYSHYRDLYGAGARPLPFDRDLRPKPAYEAMVAAFKAHAGRRGATP